jgi:hypothetical protein
LYPFREVLKIMGLDLLYYFLSSGL